MLQCLVALLVEPATATDPSLRVQALSTLAELVRGHRQCCEAMAAVTTTRKQGDTLVREAVRVGVGVGAGVGVG